MVAYAGFEGAFAFDPFRVVPMSVVGMCCVLPRVQLVVAMPPKPASSLLKALPVVMTSLVPHPSSLVS